MNAGALRALEFDRIVEAVGRFALTPGGTARLARLEPQADPSAVRGSLAATSETVRFLDEAQMALQAPTDLESTLESLDVEGRALEPLQLLALAAFLASIDATTAAIRRAKSVSILRAIADRTATFDRETAEIQQKIDPSGDVVDDASPALRGIRDRLRKQRARLRGTLESYLRGKDTAKYLQQQVVTDRNGRYVLVVRAEHRAAIPGIVHGSSGSGASLFLEPLSTVEINNDIVALEQQEQEEVRRILLALSDAFRRRAVDLQRTVEAATELDVLQARARFSALIGGIEPVVASDGRLELRAARHPLLIPAVRRHLGDASSPGIRNPRPEARSAESEPRASRPEALEPKPEARGPRPDLDPVPVDILLIPPISVLVITGPNTGGKTVALKTAGLLVLMAQAGLLVPAAEGSQLTILQSVFADIGDEQSIAESLSTFSGHIANIVSMERSLALPALVLLDEAGAGTDPVEGGALAMAIIEHFRQRGAMVVATTHYDALKSYASTTEGVTPAGFGFDPQTFAPTYRLNYGAPGSSLAFEIANRLGLPQSILERARAHRGERETQLADHLARIERDTQALEHERRLAAREREALAETAARLRAREEELKNRDATFRRRVDERIEERLREARREIDAVIERLRIRTETMATQAERAARLVPTGQSGGARAEARASIDSIGERLRRSVESNVRGDQPGAAAQPVEALPPPSIGDRVSVGPLGLEGIVRALHDRDAEVDVRGKRLRARLDDLRVLSSGATAPAAVRVNVELQARGGPVTELNVIGCHVDEALARTEKFLDDAIIGEQRTVRVIHGYGTGQLRRAIAGFLQTHPLVANFSSAPADQGGGGVTVVELKE
jgi:DNA mismatch repair protein MutS2